MGVVNLLEMVEVKEDDGELVTVAGGAVNFGIQDEIEMPGVVEGAARGAMSGPRSSRISKLRLSLASPPVKWKASGRPPRSTLRWIFVEKPLRERPSA